MNQEIEARIVNSYWTRANFLIFTKLSTLWTIEAYSVRMEPISFYPHSTLLLQQSFPFLKLKKIPLPHLAKRVKQVGYFVRVKFKKKRTILWRERGVFMVLRGSVPLWCVPPLYTFHIYSIHILRAYHIVLTIEKWI